MHVMAVIVQIRNCIRIHALNACGHFLCSPLSAYISSLRTLFQFNQICNALNGVQIVHVSSSGSS